MTCMTLIPNQGLNRSLQRIDSSTSIDFAIHYHSSVDKPPINWYETSNPLRIPIVNLAPCLVNVAPWLMDSLKIVMTLSKSSSVLQMEDNPLDGIRMEEIAATALQNGWTLMLLGTGGGLPLFCGRARITTTLRIPGLLWLQGTGLSAIGFLNRHLRSSRCETTAFPHSRPLVF